MKNLKNYIDFIFWGIGALALMITKNSNAQQAPLTAQYDIISSIQNPAYNGINQHLKIDAVTRVQWSNIPGAPVYTAVGVQSPISRDFAVGGNFQSLKIGNFKYASPLSINSFSGDLAYHKQLNKNVNLGVGLRLGLFNFNMQLSRLISSTQNDVALAGNDYNLNAPTVGGGIILYGKNYFLGASMPQYALISTNILENVNLSYNARSFYLINGGYILPVGKSKDNYLKATVQARYYAGLPVQADINIYFLYHTDFSIGYGYRTNGTQAILGNIRVNEFFKILYAYETGSVYDKNVPFTSHEFGLSYFFNQPKHQTRITPRFY